MAIESMEYINMQDNRKIKQGMCAGGGQGGGEETHFHFRLVRVCEMNYRRKPLNDRIMSCSFEM